MNVEKHIQDMNDYYKVEMQVRDELASQVIDEMRIIYGDSPEVVGAVRLATLKALLCGPRLIRERRQQNGYA